MSKTTLKANYISCVINYLQPPITSDDIEKYSELGDISKVNVSCLKHFKINLLSMINCFQLPIVSEGFEKSSEFDELGGFNNELYIANVNDVYKLGF